MVLQALLSQWSQLPGWPLPVSMSPGGAAGDSPRPAGRSGQAPFKLLLPPRVPAHDVLCVPCKSGISTSPGPEGLLQLSPDDLQMFSGLILWCQTPRPGSLMWGLRTLAPVG